MAAPNGMWAALTEDDGEWTLALKGGDELTFDENGILIAETDRNGNQETYERDGDVLTITAANEQAIVVTFASGRIDHAEYTVDGTTRRVDYALDPSPLVTYYPGQPEEHAVGYEYTGEQLSAVIAEDWPTADESVAERFSYAAGDLDEVRFADYSTSDPDRADSKVEFAYDDLTATITRFGRIGSADDGAPHTPVTEAFTWNRTGTVATQTLPRIAGEDPATTTYRYTPQNQLRRLTTAGGWTTSHRYDARGNLAAVTDESGHATTYAYDVGDNLIRSTDVLGAATDYVYDAHGNLTDVRRDLNEDQRSCTQHTYDDEGRLTQTRQLISGTPEDGVWHETDFDEDGYASSGEPFTTVERGVKLSLNSTPVDLETTRTYDGFGNLTSGTEQHLAGSVDPVIVAANSYDLAGRLTGSTDAGGVTTHHVYDSLSNEIETWRSAPGTEVKADWHQAAHDAFGRIVTERALLSFSGETPDSAVASTVTHDYDGLGRETGSDDTTVGGEPGRSVYDARGNVVASWSEGVSDYASEKASRSIYSADGRLLSDNAPGAGEPTTYTYWPDGSVRRTTSPDGSHVEDVYDAAGNLVTESAPSADGGRNEMTLAYDAGGRLIARHDEATDTTTTTEYDLLGRAILVRSSLADWLDQLTTYNSLGWTLKTTGADGSVSKTVYDEAGRVLRANNDGQTTDATYNAAGQPLTVSAETGLTTYTYDAFGSLAREEISAGGGNSYVRDSLGRETMRTDLASGATDEHAYSENAPPSPDSPAETQCDGTGTTTLIYQSPSGEEARRVTTFEDGPALERCVTARDAAGRETTVTETSASVTRVTHQAHDDLGRVKRVWGSGYEASAETTDAYTYQPGTSLVASEELQLTGGAAIKSYAYDKAGRIVAAVSGDAMTTTTYDEKGRVASTTTVTSAGQPQGAGVGGAQLMGFSLSSTVSKVYDYYADSYGGLLRSLTTMRSDGTTLAQLSYDGRRRVIGTYIGPVRRDIEREKVDPYYGQEYNYNPGSGYPGAGRLYVHEDPDTGHCNLVLYNRSSQAASIGSWQWIINPWLQVCSNLGNQSISWDGLLPRTIATDLPRNGLEAAFTYAFKADGRPAFAHVQGRSDDEDVDLFIWLVTDGEGSVIRLLDSAGERFVEYEYDATGNATVSSYATGLVDANLAADLAETQMLRYHGYPYSEPLKLYWKGDWYDPETGQWVWPQGGYSFWASPNAPWNSAEVDWLIRRTPWWYTYAEGRMSHTLIEQLVIGDYTMEGASAMSEIYGFLTRAAGPGTPLWGKALKGPTVENVLASAIFFVACEGLKHYDEEGGGNGVLWRIQCALSCPAVGHFRVWPLDMHGRPIEEKAGNIVCWPLWFDPY